MTKATKPLAVPKPPAAATKNPGRKAAAAPAKKPAAPRKSPVKEVATGAGSTKNRKPQVSNEQRRRYIEVAAYFMAERRGFIGANPAADWMQAEIEVDRMLSEGKLDP
ncbi:MAG TPA: DUF2934 domain-containing protein [Rhodocyclaceae bacterium]|nr:DUF2934 domain-containing protein [Rhodocyclaceae bacterium]